MTRYYYIPLVLTAVINLFIQVPSMLIRDRTDGALSAMLLSAVIGTILSYLFSKAMTRFPGEGLPEIFARVFPKWVHMPLLGYLGIMWFLAGALVAIYFIFVMHRIAIPEMHPFFLALCYGTAVAWGATRSTRSIMFAMEIILLLNIPFILVVLAKALGNEQFDADPVRAVLDYVWEAPSLRSLAAATFIFTGYINLAVINRMFKTWKRKPRIWVIPVIGFPILLISYFVPVAYLGTSAVGNYVYPWIAAMDSIRMPYGVVERILFVYLLVYLNLTLVFTIMTSHISIQLVQGIFVPKTMNVDRNVSSKASWVVTGLFIVIFLILTFYMNEKSALQFMEDWLVVRMFSEIGLVLLVYLFSKKRRHAL